MEISPERVTKIIDSDAMAIHICRAVTHPTRNQPEIKDTKTQSSTRTIGLSALAVPYLLQVKAGEFVFGGKSPLSYTHVRRMCDRIKRDIGFDENITPIRFRTTVLTDLYDQTKDIKLAQAAAGHTTSAMTLRYYVKAGKRFLKPQSLTRLIPNNPQKLQIICKHENREPLGAQWFEDRVTSEKLQNSLQKAYFPGKEVIPDFQMSPPKLQKLKKNHPNQ